MATRRTLFVTGPAVALTLAAARCARAQNEQQRSENADFLFVQTSKEVTFDKPASKLTLNGVSSVTLFFSNRPERVARNMKTAAFVPFWSEGKDSFLSDPPNADISILEDNMDRQEPPACIKPAPASDCAFAARSEETLRSQHPEKECRP